MVYMQRQSAALFVFAAAALLGVPLAAIGDEPRKPKPDLYGDPLPEGAVARMGTARLRHSDAAIAFAPDGKTLISAGTSGDVRYWETATGKEIRRVPLRRTGSKMAHTRGHRLSGDGTVFAGWEQGDDAFAVYDARTGKELHRFAAGSAEWGWVHLSRDGKTLAGASRHTDHETETVRVWDLTTGKKKWEGTGQEFSWGMALSPDGRLLVLGDRSSKSLKVVDLESGKEAGRVAAEVFNSHFSADCKVLAITPRSSSDVVAIWDTETLTEKRRIQFPGILNMRLEAVSTDGTVVACSVAGGLVLMAAADKKPRRVPCVPPWQVTFSADGKWLAAAGSEDIRIFDVATGKSLHDLPGHRGTVYGLALSRDGKFVASSARWWDRFVHVWDASNGKLLQSVSGVNRFAAACDFSADGKQLLTGGTTGTVQLWDWAAKKKLRQFQMNFANGIGDQVQNQEALRIAPDAKRVMAVGISSLAFTTEAHLYVWDAENGNLLDRRLFPLDFMSRPNPGGGSASRISFNSCFSPDGTQVTVWSKEGLQIAETITARRLAMISGNLGCPTAFSSDARLLAGGIRKADADPFEPQVEAIGIYEAVTGKEVMRLTSGPSQLLAFSWDGRFLATSEGKNLRVWDIASGKQVLQRAWPEGMVPHPSWSPASALAFVPHQKHLVSGMVDGTLLVWDMAQLYRDPPAERPLGNDSLRQLWKALQGDDAGSAFQAQVSLATSPRQAISFLKDHLSPAQPVDAKHVEKLIADLDNEQFAVRDAAAKELAKVAEQIGPMLRKARDTNPSPEVKRRAAALLATPYTVPSGDRLRTLRAIAALERTGTAEARDVLKQLAGGDAPARETREAKAALERLAR